MTDIDQSLPTPWHNLPPDTVLARMHTLSTGLSLQEADIRLQTYGRNELRETKPISPLAILMGQFSSLVVWILIGAGIISAFLGEWVDGIAILAIVILNAVIGFYQEYNAEKAIAALKKMAAPQAKVRRNGQVIAIPAAQVVPGDVIEIEAGDLVPADARLLEAASLKSVEAALTGESVPVAKRASTLDQIEAPLGDRKNMVFMGTSVAWGSGRAVVVATGMETEFGRIAGLLQEASLEEGTPLQKRLQAVGQILVWATLGIVGTIFALGLLRNIPAFELFLVSVSLAVAAIPEGLPAVVTIALALGVQRMARRRALVRKLPAVETLGSTNVICTDKTGTLTLGEMTVRELFVAGETFTVTGEGYGLNGNILLNGKPPAEPASEQLRLFLTLLVGCNSAHLTMKAGVWKVIGDPTEGALLTAGLKFGVEKSAVETDLPKIHEFPFDSTRKRMSVLRKTSSGTLRAMVKGAPDILLERCTHILTEGGIRVIKQEDRERITAKMDDMAQHALRILAAGFRDIGDGVVLGEDPDIVERDLIFVGLIGMYDPPRPEARDAVARCISAGIRVVMITGDHPQTALVIAEELSITGKGDIAVSGIKIDKLSDDELQQLVPTVSVYARVNAEHKLRIVRAWKANGAIVAMTGDGVNDAPAIKLADIGIAMGKTGTEVTKEASDMIITDDNFASIVAAVEEGRGIYDNIKKTLQYLLAGNLGELLVVTSAVMTGLPVPLLPIHLLWINLVTDGFPALALATDPIDPDIMKQPPRRRTEQITDRSFFALMIFTGILTAAVTLSVYIYELRHATEEVAITYAFATLIYAEVLRSFGVRSTTKTVWEIDLFSNFKLSLVVGLTMLFQPWSHHVPFLQHLFKIVAMPWSECFMLIAIGLIPLVVLEMLKIVRRSFNRPATLIGHP